MSNDRSSRYTERIDPPWSAKNDEEREKKDREDKRKRKEYFNILLRKAYNPLRLQEEQPQIITSIYYY